MNTLKLSHFNWEVVLYNSGVFIVRVYTVRQVAFMQYIFPALLVFTLLSCAWSRQSVTLNYQGIQRIQACTGDTVIVNWQGYHNIQETKIQSCDANQQMGNATIGYHSQYHSQSFDVELVAAPGQERYFKCTLHCQRVHFSVYCPSTPLANMACVDSSVGVATATGDFVNLGDVVPGMSLLTSAGHSTTVRRVTHDQSIDAPFAVKAGQCGSHNLTIISPSHAISCNGRWVVASEIAHRHPLVHPVSYTNVETDNYCNDALVLQTGLIVETWDGFGPDEWRPHSYSHGERLNCVPISVLHGIP